MVNIDTVVAHYIACALWSSTDDNGDPLDGNFSADDLAPETPASLAAEVANFIAYVEEVGIVWGDRMSAEQFGHDFWLTRNGHGAGFWDRGLGELGDRLTDAAETFGSCDLYVGDDGRLYV